MTLVEQDSRSRASPACSLPLCVDLDGTLIYSDSLEEGIVAADNLGRVALAFLKLPFSGRAGFKHRIANSGKLEPALLPYNQSLVEYLRAQKEAGRYLVLATAANRLVAEGVAEHLGLFDEIVASDETHNLKGRRKAEALCGRFGEKGFVYAGNDASDIPVWAAASAAILVNAPPGVAHHARKMVPLETIVPSRAKTSFPLLRAMRPHQWLKNLLVFVPIITAHALRDIASWFNASLAFAAFCAAASAIYLINDAVDLAADRRHPRKKSRPFANGSLSLSTGLITACLLAGLGASLAIASGTLLVIVTYAVMSVSYSLKLKELPLVDVFLLAGLYTIRLFGGGIASGHEVSLWLLAFSGFLFLGLALLKRVTELSALSRMDKQFVGRRGTNRVLNQPCHRPCAHHGIETFFG